MARGFLTTTAPLHPDSNQDSVFTTTSADFVVDLGSAEAHQFEIARGIAVDIEVLVVQPPAGGQPAGSYVALTVEHLGSRKAALISWGHSIKVGDRIKVRVF